MPSVQSGRQRVESGGISRFSGSQVHLVDHRGQSRTVLRFLGLSGHLSGPDPGDIATILDLHVQRVFGLRGSKVDDPCIVERFQYSIELFDQFGELVPHELGLRVLRNLDIISDDPVCTTAREHAPNPYALNGRRVVRGCRSYVPAVIAGPLFRPRGQMRQEGDLSDQAFAEDREVVGSGLRGRDDHDLHLWVLVELPQDECRGYPALTDPTERLNDLTLGAVL